MKLNGTFGYTCNIAVLVLALLFTSCKDDERRMEPLDNTTWISSKDSCDSYFHFEDGEYILLTVCHDDEDVIKLVSGERGAYDADDRTLETNTEKACSSELIGFSLIFPVDALPSIPTSAEYGYWDINNQNAWVSVEECTLL